MFFVLFIVAVLILGGTYVLLPDDRKRQLRSILRDKYHALYVSYARFKRKHVDVIPEAQRIGDCLLIRYSYNSGIYNIFVPIDNKIKVNMIGMKVFAVSSLAKTEMDITQQNGVGYMMSPKSLDCDIIKFVKNGETVMVLDGDETYTSKKLESQTVASQ